MKKILSLLILAIFTVTFIACEKAEKGREGIKESNELREKINKDIQDTRKTGNLPGDEENKPSEKEK